MRERKYEPTPMGKKPYYTYELSYPQGFIDDDGTDLSNVVFYVGKGSVLPTGIQRIDIHEALVARSDDGFEKAKEKTIQRIWSKGMSVQKRITFESDSHQDVSQRESELINEHWGPYITNIVRPRPGLAPVWEDHPVFVLDSDVLERWLFDCANGTDK